MQRRSAFGLGIMWGLFWLAACSAGKLSAQDSALLFPRPYDGFQASAEAQAIGDAQRLDAINRQIGWNELFKWRAALSQGMTALYSPYVPGFGWGWDVDPLDGWPYAVGRIVGPGFFDPVRQPIGRREIQTGPNRWESFPIYAGDVQPRNVAPVPPLAAPPAPAASPAPTRRSREF